MTTTNVVGAMFLHKTWSGYAVYIVVIQYECINELNRLFIAFVST